VRNQADCKITVNTSQLMLAQTYERKIFLHTNSVPEINYSLTLKVQTAPLPRANNQQIYTFLAWMFGVSLIEAAIFAINVAWLRVAAGVAVFSIGFVFGRRSSWADVKLSFWCWSIAGVVLTAKACSVIGAVPQSDVVNPTSESMSVTLLVSLAAIAGIMFGAKDRSVAVPGGTVWQYLQTEFGTILAVVILLLTSALGISLGLGFKLGFLFVIYAVLATGLPLAWMMIYMPKARSRLIAQYRKSEQHLIKP
jgi:hypothetical protein